MSNQPFPDIAYSTAPQHLQPAGSESKTPWSQGRTLITNHTRRWTPEQRKANDEQYESLRIFSGLAPEWSGGLVATCERAEDARRIVACVNACTGIDTGLLGSLRWKSLGNQISGLTDENGFLQACNAELLDAAQSALMAITGYTHQNDITRRATEQLQHAIAKATAP